MSESRNETSLDLQIRRMLKVRPVLITFLAVNCLLLVAVPFAKTKESQNKDVATQPTDQDPEQNRNQSQSQTAPLLNKSQNQTKSGRNVSATRIARHDPVANKGTEKAPNNTETTASQHDAAPTLDTSMDAKAWIARAAGRLTRVLEASHPVASDGIDEFEAGAVIYNPNETGGTVHFLANEGIITLPPGSYHLLDAGECVVQFHRGGKFGETKLLVSGGVYEFQVAADGWKLVELRP